MRKYLLVAVGLCLFLGAQALQADNVNIVGDIAQCKAYNVNIIAYDKCPKTENAQRIAVLASFTSDVTNGDPISVYVNDKRNTILLTPGETFRVLESNACDTDGAELQVPPTTGDDFYVYVRLVGAPGGGVRHFLCRTDTDLATIVCQTGAVLRTRTTGKGNPVFVDVTNELLKIGSESLFDESLEDYFWVWNTVNKPHAQVWFIDKTCLDAL